MQVSKWGNSLAVRLPAKLVEELGLKEGDEVEVRAAGTTALEVEPKPKPSVDQLFEDILRMEPKLPADYKFRRDDAYPSNRGGSDDGAS